jgi:hypothetical protein
MFSGVDEHVIYRISNAAVREYPYPHIYVDSVFPEDFYAALRKNWPGAANLVSIGETGRVTKGAYAERHIMPLLQAEVDKLAPEARAFWNDASAWLLAPRFINSVVARFGRYVEERFRGNVDEIFFHGESLVVRDHTNYRLGPHTDSPDRLVSLLFYCPDDSSMPYLGTSLYVPIDNAFRCAGGVHHPRELFRKAATMEYRPNTLFAFVKTDNSFHGVESIRDTGVLRDVLLYDIRVSTRPRQKAALWKWVPGSGLGGKMLRNLLRGGR